MTKEIGGYLDLSANWRVKALEGAPILLNSARNCIRYVVQQRAIKRIHLPYYTCDTVVQALAREDVEITFYSIDDSFKPLLPAPIDNECILYVNYYGLMDENVGELCKTHENIIIDNAQAYFSKPLLGVDTVSSSKKFFGLPDGGVLYPGADFPQAELPLDRSSQRFTPLVKRIDEGATAAYADSVSIRKKLNDEPIKRMSDLTRLLLGAVDEGFAKQARRDNWAFLDNHLSDKNRINLSMSDDAVPLFYAYFSDNADLRQYLINNKVYVGTYWPSVKQKVDSSSFEYAAVDNMIPLPIDQRYSREDMLRLIRLLENFEH